MNNGRRWIILSSLDKARNGTDWCWFELLVEASLVHADKSVSTCSIIEVMNAERIWFHLRARHLIGMIVLESVCMWDAVNADSLLHLRFCVMKKVIISDQLNGLLLIM